MEQKSRARPRNYHLAGIDCEGSGATWFCHTIKPTAPTKAPFGGSIQMTKWIPFTVSNINNLYPDGEGVYKLWKGGEVSYIGSSSYSVKSRLARHYNGDEGPCTKASTHFCYELCPNADAMEKSLLHAFWRANGRLPACNDRIG